MIYECPWVVLFCPKKHPRIKWKNRIYFFFLCVVKDVNRNLHAFFYLIKKIIFWRCLFPTILKPHKWASENPKFGQKLQILPKSSKINKINILKYTVCKFYDCRNCFWRNDNILNSKKKIGEKPRFFFFKIAHFFFLLKFKFKTGGKK